MSDLAARLREIIEDRLRVAQAAAEIANGPFDGTGIVVMRLHGGGIRTVVLPSEVARFLVRNNPANAILASERDLAVLERHAPDPVVGGCEAGCREWCPYPDPEHVGPPDDGGWDRQDWPCSEITAMAKRYGVSTDG